MFLQEQTRNTKGNVEESTYNNRETVGNDVFYAVPVRVI
jgi:hypothetical protein